MKIVYYNDTARLLPHLRAGFIEGKVKYRDQTEPVRFESSKTQDILSGELKQYGGHRPGILTRDHTQQKRPKK